MALTTKFVMKAELSENQLKRITDSIVSGRKIEAIKEYREATGQGLKEAKDAVEEITASLAVKHPELAKKKSSGCVSVIVVGLILCYGVFEVGQVLW